MCVSQFVLFFVGKTLTSLWRGESSDRGLWLTSHRLPPGLRVGRPVWDGPPGRAGWRGPLVTAFHPAFPACLCSDTREWKPPLGDLAS